MAQAPRQASDQPLSEELEVLVEAGTAGGLGTARWCDRRRSELHSSAPWSWTLKRQLLAGAAVGAAGLVLAVVGAVRLGLAGRVVAGASRVKLYDEKYPAPPSLFCFSVTRASEVALIRAQFQHRSSLFACEESAVLCSGCAPKMSLGYAKEGEVFTWETPLPAAEVSKGWSDDSYLNAGIFIQAWDSLIESGRPWAHDWTVKVDPDAVYFPDRLRFHLIPYKGKRVYFANCNSTQFRKTEPEGPKLFGALEVFSKEAVETYKRGKARCEKGDYASMPEDYYMQTCMDMLNVTREFDANLISDWRCYSADCDDWTRVSFHPFREVDDYFSCLGKAVGAEE